MIPCYSCDVAVSEIFIMRFLAIIRVLLSLSGGSLWPSGGPHERCLEGQRGRLESDLNAVWRASVAV